MTGIDYNVVGRDRFGSYHTTGCSECILEEHDIM